MLTWMSQLLLLQRESAKSISENAVIHLNSPDLILICGNNCNTSHLYGILYSLSSHLAIIKKSIEEPNDTVPTAPVDWVMEFLFFFFLFPFLVVSQKSVH